MDVVYLLIIIIFWSVILFLTLRITLLLEKIFRKTYPPLQKIGDRLGAIIFKKRKEKEST